MQAVTGFLMKRSLFSACVAALWICGAAQASAQQAQGSGSDCDILCRLKGYLATDHMAAGASRDGLPQAAKVKHGRTAAAKSAVAKTTTETAGATKPPAIKGAVQEAHAGTAVPRPAPGRSAAKRTSLPRAAEAAPVSESRRRAAKPAAVVAAVRETVPPVAPTKAPGHHHRTETRTPIAAAAEAGLPRSEAVAADPRPAAPAKVAEHPARRAVRTAAAADASAGALSLIPGSAPLMAAGFKPIGGASLR